MQSNKEEALNKYLERTKKKEELLAKSQRALEQYYKSGSSGNSNNTSSSSADQPAKSGDTVSKKVEQALQGLNTEETSTALHAKTDE